MQTLIFTVAPCLFLYALLTLVYPIGFIKTRKQGWALAVGSILLMAFGANYQIAQHLTDVGQSSSPAALLPAAKRVAEAPLKGEIIDVPSDLGAEYRIAELSKNNRGNAVVMTSRKGPSGTSFSLRECECPFGRFRYLGEGESIEAANKPRAPAERMVDLVSDGQGTGSVSYHVCAIACTRVSRGNQQAQSPRSSSAPSKMDTFDIKSRALIYCSRYAKAASRHPSTVSFTGWGAKVDVHSDGSATVTSPFTAKNSFGLELRHQITCQVSQGGDVSAQIVESD